MITDRPWVSQRVLECRKRISETRVFHESHESNPPALVATLCGRIPEVDSGYNLTS